MTEFWIVFFIILIGMALVCIAAVLVSYSRDIRAARKRVKILGSQVIEPVYFFPLSKVI
jgi:hypothetical protein